MRRNAVTAARECAKQNAGGIREHDAQGATRCVVRRSEHALAPAIGGDTNLVNSYTLSGHATLVIDAFLLLYRLTHLLLRATGHGAWSANAQLL